MPMFMLTKNGKKLFSFNKNKKEHKKMVKTFMHMSFMGQQISCTQILIDVLLV